MVLDNYYPDDGKARVSLPKVNRDRWNPRTPFNNPQLAIPNRRLLSKYNHLAACRLDVLQLEEALLVRGAKPRGQNDYPTTFNEGYKKGFAAGRKEGITIGGKEKADEEVERWAVDVSSSQSDHEQMESGEGFVKIEAWKVKALVWFFCTVVFTAIIWVSLKSPCYICSIMEH